MEQYLLGHSGIKLAKKHRLNLEAGQGSIHVVEES